MPALRLGDLVYTKLFKDILLSSLWAEDSDTRIVWVTLLALADQDGMVSASASGIAHAARVDGEITKDALAKFCAPDPDSRTPDNEGRRIEHVTGGYVILNYRLYRDKKNPAEERAKTRERVRKHRARKKIATGNADVTKSNKSNDKQKQKQKHMQKKKRKTLAPSDSDESSSLVVPADLEGLELYETDKRLCRDWKAFLKAAEPAYPGVDVIAEVRKAHAWEVANPAKRKKQRTRFLHNWLARAQDRPGAGKGADDVGFITDRR